MVANVIVKKRLVPVQSYYLVFRYCVEQTELDIKSERNQNKSEKKNPLLRASLLTFDFI